MLYPLLKRFSLEKRELTLLISECSRPKRSEAKLTLPSFCASTALFFCTNSIIRLCVYVSIPGSRLSSMWETAVTNFAVPKIFHRTWNLIGSQ